jgi:Zn-dependent peptidase ImmA (M78 family)
MPRSIKNIAELAYKLLLKYNLLTSPVDVYKIAELLGIKIVPSDLGEDVSGVLVFKAEGPIIGVNSTEFPQRKRFTIAHELGHFVLGHGREGLFVDNFKLFRDAKTATGEEYKEIEANAFAASLLMPSTLVREEYFKLTNGQVIKDESKHEKIIGDLAKKFEVSKLAMSIRYGNLMLYGAF